MTSPTDSPNFAGFSTPWERRFSLFALGVSWLAVLAYFALLVTNIVRFFTERAATASYPALLAWWLALPGQIGDGGLPLALLPAAFAVAFLVLLLPATRAILLPALWAALPGWIQQFFIWTPNVRDPGYPRTGTTRAIRGVLYVAWVALVAPTIANYGPSLLALVPIICNMRMRRGDRADVGRRAQMGSSAYAGRRTTGAHDHPLRSGCPALPHMAGLEQARANHAGCTARADG
jgi:hypothetical protein